MYKIYMYKILYIYALPRAGLMHFSIGDAAISGLKYEICKVNSAISKHRASSSELTFVDFCWWAP